jgi:hypothetical protein
VYAILLLLGLDIPPQLLADVRLHGARKVSDANASTPDSPVSDTWSIKTQEEVDRTHRQHLADLPRRFARFVNHPHQSAMLLYHFVKYNVIVFLTKRTTSLHPFRGRTLLSHLRPPHAS